MVTTSNRIERMNREMRRRVSQVVFFPNIESCLRLNTLICMEYVKVGIYSPLFNTSTSFDFSYADSFKVVHKLFS
jgi:transposase-like protein